MKTQRDFNLNNFVKINDINIFRLENGNIAAEDPDNEILALEKTDDVKVISLTVGEKTVAFFKINNNRINALFTTSFIELQEDADFTDIYLSENYEGVYCKYISSRKVGIIYVSETEISQVISHENGYEDIWFENEIFLAKKENEEIFCAIAQSGAVVLEKEYKFKKVKDFGLFYTDNRIFSYSKEIQLPEKIENVEVISEIGYYERREQKNYFINRKILEISSDPEKRKKDYNPAFDEILSTRLKVTTNKGIYFYNEFLKYLAGPMQNPVIKTIYQTTVPLPDSYRDDIKLPFVERKSSKQIDYYILDEIDGKVVSVSYIVNRHLVNQIFSNANGFELKSHLLEHEDRRKRLKKEVIFFSDGNSLYAPDLNLICKKLNTYEETGKYDSSNIPNKIYLTAYDKNGMRYECLCICTADYENEVVIENKSFAFDGLNSTKVYKIEDDYKCFDEDDNLIFEIKAQNGKVVNFKNNSKKYYLFNTDDIYTILDENGKEVNFNN